MEYDRQTYYRDDDFHVYLEEIDGEVAIHVGITRFSKSIFKRIKEKWGEVVLKMYYLGYEDLFAYTKDNRIVKMIGGAEKVGQHKDYEVWKWELK